jgi:hypothetical protein
MSDMVAGYQRSAVGVEAPAPGPVDSVTFCRLARISQTTFLERHNQLELFDLLAGLRRQPGPHFARPLPSKRPDQGNRGHHVRYG